MGILGFIVTLFWGILAGIAVTILIVYLINELMDTPKWLVGLIGLFLLFFLSFQFTAIIGAGKVKGVVEDITGLSNTVSGKVDWNNIETGIQNHLRTWQMRKWNRQKRIWRSCWMRM